LYHVTLSVRSGKGRERERKRKITEKNIMIMKRGGGREAQRKE
jgi:hypothetical protein